MSDAREALPVRNGAVLYGHGEVSAPVRLEPYRHEGVVVRNVQHFRGLDWLSAAWVLSPAGGPAEGGGPVLTAPVGLPVLRPGETAPLPVPFAAPGGGEAWLTLRVTTARDEPWAPRGTVVCLPRTRLRPSPASCPRVAPAPGAGIEVDADGLPVHPLLTAAPTLSLRRKDGPLVPVRRRLVSVRRAGAAVGVLAEYVYEGGRNGGFAVRHEQVFTRVEGGLRAEESAELPGAASGVTWMGAALLPPRPDAHSPAVLPPGTHRWGWVLRRL
ncbi:DUF4981 domain-containing protein [Streptomyces sp. NPDC006610]|uniref:DUF4981 domain-containing protein n=1 Tax=Streptomyces sp. NPDC006610 TaxID=3154584 RepID=UPI0033B95A81